MLNFLFLFILTVQKEKKTTVNCKVKKKKERKKTKKKKLLAGLGRTISRQNIMGEREEKVNDMHYWQKKKRIKSQKYLLLYTPIKCQNLVSQARSLIAEASD